MTIPGRFEGYLRAHPGLEYEFQVVETHHQFKQVLPVLPEVDTDPEQGLRYSRFASALNELHVLNHFRTGLRSDIDDQEVFEPIAVVLEDKSCQSDTYVFMNPAQFTPDDLPLRDYTLPILDRTDGVDRFFDGPLCFQDFGSRYAKQASRNRASLRRPPKFTIAARRRKRRV